jgi:hypothetical protein
MGQKNIERMERMMDKKVKARKTISGKVKKEYGKA